MAGFVLTKLVNTADLLAPMTSASSPSIPLAFLAEGYAIHAFNYKGRAWLDQ